MQSGRAPAQIVTAFHHHICIQDKIIHAQQTDNYLNIYFNVAQPEMRRRNLYDLKIDRTHRNKLAPFRHQNPTPKAED